MVINLMFKVHFPHQIQITDHISEKHDYFSGFYRFFSTWLLLSGFWEVGHTRMRAHQNVARVQRTLQEVLLGLRHMYTTQRSFG